MKRTIKQRVDRFMKRNPEIDLTAIEMNEIYETGGIFNIITYAFYLGYMRGMRARKGGT